MADNGRSTNTGGGGGAAPAARTDGRRSQGNRGRRQRNGRGRGQQQQQQGGGEQLSREDLVAIAASVPGAPVAAVHTLSGPERFATSNEALCGHLTATHGRAGVIIVKELRSGKLADLTAS